MSNCMTCRHNDLKSKFCPVMGVHTDLGYVLNCAAWSPTDKYEMKRLKAENAKLRELAKQMHICLTRPKVYDGGQTYLTATECPYFTEGACNYNACGFERRMQELDIEVDR